MSNPAMTEEEFREHREIHTKWNSWWLHDAQGIPCARVCDTPGCEEHVRGRYRPEVFGDYSTVEEQIEPDGDDFTDDGYDYGCP